MPQEDFFSPVIRALAAREQILFRRQQAEIQQKRLEQEEKRINLFEKQNERLLKQQEAAQKAKNLQMGVELKLLADQKRAELTGTPTSPASRSIPGSGQVQQQPLLENILQQRGLVNELPTQDILVRGQENAPVNLDIPDPFTGESQLRLPIGTTRELTRERRNLENTRRQEERRKLQLTGQLEGIKAGSKAQAELPAKVLLERVKNENAVALETDRQKNREALANIRGKFQIAAARERGSSSTDDINSFAALAEEVGLGLQSPPGASKDKRAVTNILHANGWVTPPKNMGVMIDQIGQAPILLGQIDSIINKLGEPGILGAGIEQAGRALINPVFPQEVIKQRETLSAQLAPIMRNIFQEKGNLANRDIERGEALFPDLSANPKDNVRRRELLNLLFETSINNSMRALPDTQKKAIFERYSIPYRVLTPAQIDKQYGEIDKFIEGGGSAKAVPSDSEAPKVTGGGKIVEFDGRKYPIGESFNIGNKTYKWRIKGETAVPVEVQ